MKNDNLYTGEEARKKMAKGIEKVAEAVGKTMGTAGQNAIIEALERPGYAVTNDGYSIANAIFLVDPLERLGQKVLLEAINRANRASGDGSSTTCVLTAAILEEGAKHLKDSSPMELKRSLEECIPLIEASIASQKKDVTVDEIEAVATISAEDESIGKMIQEIYQKIGKSGIIQWDVSKTSKDSYTVGNGIEIAGASYMSPYMCDIDEKGNLSTTVRWQNAAVLLLRQKVTGAIEFEKLFQELFNNEVRELVIFVDEIEAPVIADLIRTRAMRGFKSVVIKMPVLWKEDWWEDLAIASGAKIIGMGAYATLKNMKLSDLGSFGYITVTKESTYLEGIKNDIGKHILALQVDGSDEALQRAERLNIKTARYFVGAHSESALAYRRLKVEDSINAANCALQNGVVAGGGVALANAADELPDNLGGRLLKKALYAPMMQIIKNTGKEVPISSLGDTIGIDSRTGEEVDMFEANIVDASDVVLNAARNAIGVAASILTAGTVVIIPETDDAKAIQ